MKVVHVIGNLMHGGAEAVLYALVTYPSDVEHHVVSVGPPAHYSTLLAKHGIPVTHLDAASFATRLRSPLRLIALLRRLQPDLVQTWMYRANVVGGLCAAYCRIPLVWAIHNASYRRLSPAAKLWVYLSGVLARWHPDRIINCSVVSAALHDRIGFGRAPLRVIPNGYDLGRFHPDAEDGAAVRANLGVAPGTFLFGTVSRWHPQKDIPNLVSALGRLKASNAGNWHCLLVGRGLDPANPALAEQIAQAGIQDRITLLGERPDVDLLMRALDLLVLPSAEEAFPNVVAEAMASGVPCLVTRVGDAPMMVGETGWIVPPGDSDALADALSDARNEWAADPLSWKARQRAARERVEANYSLERMVAGYREVWEQAVAERRASRRSGGIQPRRL